MANVAHFWAENALGSGDVKLLAKYTGDGKRSNFYWRGDTIYSYGPHFPIARVVTVRKEKVVLFTRRTYSVTTAKHISYTHRALNGRPNKVFHVARVDVMPDKAVEKAYYSDAAATAFAKVLKARDYASMHVRDGLAAIAEGNRLSKFFRLGFTLKAPANIKELVKMARVKQAAAEVRRAEKRVRDSARYERERIAREARDARAAAFLPLYLEAWKRGEDLERPDDIGYFSVPSDSPTLLRVKNGVVETSRGAEVPLADAVNLIALIRDVRAGAGYVAGSFKVGEFVVNSIAEKGDLTIGCHRISGTEVDRFVGSLGL